MDRRKQLEKMTVLGELSALARKYNLDIDHLRKGEIIDAILEHETTLKEPKPKQKRAPRKAARTKLKAMRVKAGLTQSEVATSIGVSLATYSNYEQGAKSFDSARLGVILKACVVLSCYLEDIIESEETLEIIQNYKNQCV